MNIIKTINNSVLKTWLNELGVEHYICDHCHGLHLVNMQSREGVLESRLFAEEWGLLISTEYHLRPSAVLPLVAEMGLLNANFPTLKVFLDVEDDTVPQLVAGATAYTGAGLTEAQFALFVSTSVEMMNQLAEDLLEMNCLLIDSEPQDTPFSLH